VCCCIVDLKVGVCGNFDVYVCKCEFRYCVCDVVDFFFVEDDRCFGFWCVIGYFEYV